MDHTPQAAPEGGKRISIEEVARALGISKTTVSRALSGKGRVSEATCARVRAYLASAGAMPAVRGEAAAPPTHNLALVIPRQFVQLDLPFLRSCMGGVCTMAAQRSYDLLLCYADAADTAQLERQLAGRKMDGALLARTVKDDPCVRLLRRHRLPFVAIGRTEDAAVPQLDSDQAGAACEMTRLLLQLGLRRIALLTGSTLYYVNEDRRSGYLQALAGFGLAAQPQLVRTGIESDAQRTEALDAVLEQHPDCLLCGDDRLAFDVMMELQVRQLQVPGQLCVASLYDSALLAGLGPGVSAVQFDAAALGAAACQMLLDMLAGKQPPARPQPGYQVILRGSTKRAEFN